MVLEHSRRKLFFHVGLDLDVDEQPACGAVRQPYLEQLVGQQLSKIGAASNLHQFLVERLEAFRPVDVAMDIGKEKRQEARKVDVQRLLPWAIVFLQGSRAFGHVQILTRSLPGVNAVLYDNPNR